MLVLSRRFRSPYNGLVFIDKETGQVALEILLTKNGRDNVSVGIDDRLGRFKILRSELPLPADSTGSSSCPTDPPETQSRSGNG